MARPLSIASPGAVAHVMTRGNNRPAYVRDDYDGMTYAEEPLHACEAEAVHRRCSGSRCAVMSSREVHRAGSAA